MRYLGASAAVLVAAMTVSLSPLGRTARASDDKPVIRSTIERNTILPFSASSPSTSTIDIERYGGKEKKPTELQALALIYPSPKCEEIAEGTWTYTDTQTCGKEKCGKVTTGTRTASEGSGFCGGKQFTFATISYEWTAHNNQSTLSAPADKVADTFNATWTSGTTPNYTAQFTFNINVPVVRPDHEETAFGAWDRTYGLWRQKLVPPSSDLMFDFSGETVQEFAAIPAGPDTCWFPDSKKVPFESVASGPKSNPWTVAARNTYGLDKVGYGFDLGCGLN